MAGWYRQAGTWQAGTGRLVHGTHLEREAADEHDGGVTLAAGLARQHEHQRRREREEEALCCRVSPTTRTTHLRGSVYVLSLIVLVLIVVSISLFHI